MAYLYRRSYNDPATTAQQNASKHRIQIVIAHFLALLLALLLVKMAFGMPAMQIMEAPGNCFGASFNYFFVYGSYFCAAFAVFLHILSLSYGNQCNDLQFSQLFVLRFAFAIVPMLFIVFAVFVMSSGICVRNHAQESLYFSLFSSPIGFVSLLTIVGIMPLTI